MKYLRGEGKIERKRKVYDRRRYLKDPITKHDEKVFSAKKKAKKLKAKNQRIQRRNT